MSSHTLDLEFIEIQMVPTRWLVANWGEAEETVRAEETVATEEAVAAEEVVAADEAVAAEEAMMK